MDTTQLTRPQVPSVDSNCFPQALADVARNPSPRIMAELIVEGMERGWISKAAGARALVATENGSFSIRRLTVLLLAGATQPHKRRVHVLKLLTSKGIV
jgi:hypothetical protein